MIGTTAQLTFQPVIAARVNSNSLASFGQELLPALDDPDEFYLLDAGAVVTGEELVDAQPSFDQNGRPAVNFRFNPSGARKFGDYTAENIGNPFAIVLDNEVVCNSCSSFVVTIESRKKSTLLCRRWRFFDV